MNIFSRMFKSASNALTISNPAAQGSDASWQGFEITNNASYNFSIIRNREEYVSEESMDEAEYDGYPSSYKKYLSHNVRIGQRLYLTISNPFLSYPLDTPYTIWYELERQSPQKKLAAVRESGIGSVDLMEISYDLRLLDLETIKSMIDYRRDEGIFDEVSDNDERALFDFRQTSETPLLLTYSRPDNKPVVIVKAGSYQGNLQGGTSQDFEIKYYFKNTAEMIDTLVNDTEIAQEVFGPSTNTVYIAGVDNLDVKPKPLPAELYIKLQREVVLSRLSSGKKGRLLSVEKAIQQEIRDNITKLAARFGADEASETVKTEFLWMSITEDGLRGTVQTGQYEKRSFASMTPNELREFYKECKGDEDSKALMEAYFKHINFDEFRKKKEWGRRKAPTENDMGVGEACDVLGLKVPVDDEVISKNNIANAFRSAAKDNNHDSGALNKSTEELDTATENMKRINQARDVLMQRFGND